MYQTAFYPLRTVVGAAVEVAGKKMPKIDIVEESAESQKLEMQFDFERRYSLAETEANPRYRSYLPVFELPGAEPATGMDTLPRPVPFPFEVNTPVTSLFALSKTLKSADVSRKLSVKLHIKLSQEALVGGICYGGFPYLPYRIMETGESSSNFGLPREVRLTCLGGSFHFDIQAIQATSTRSKIRDFIDAESSVTKQDIISHSGLHFLCTDPTRTDSLILHLSDFPSILTKVRTAGRIEEKYGFIIPYFYVFEYQEKTRYEAVVPAGLLGAMRTPDTNRVIIDTSNNPPPGYARVVQAISDSHLVDHSRRRGMAYMDFTSTSMFGQQREYPAAKGHREVSECFVSDPVQPGGKVILYIQQAEDFDRCIAGLKAFFPFVPEVGLAEDLAALTDQLSAFFPNIDLTLLAGVPRENLEVALRAILRLPDGVDFCERIGIRVYELDPLDGVSPLLVPLDSKHATLLADQQIDELSEIGLAMFLEGIKFIRPSHAKYFAIELTNLDDKKGQIVIKRLALIQSAHVSVHPRASRTQQVKVLNFRIIGANLAEDYAALGNEGFNFSIERFVAGERKSVLFRANSLLDLLHTGAAKIFSNTRRRAVEFEMVENYREIKGKAEQYQIKRFDRDDFSRINFENRETDNNSTSWRSNESGRDITWDLGKGNPNFQRFENFSGTETRSRNQQVSSLLDPTFSEILTLRNQLQRLVSTMPTGGLLELATASDMIFRNHINTNTYAGIWKPFQRFGLNQHSLPALPGYQTLNIPPFYLSIMDSLNAVLSTLTLDFDSIDFGMNLQIRSAAIDNLIARLALVNGLSVGLSGGMGASLSEAAVVAAAAAGVPIPIIPSVSGGASLSVNSNLTSALRTSTNGAVGSIIQSGQEVKYSLNQTKQLGFDNNILHTEANEAEQKRVVTRRELLGRDKERVRGAEVMWQGELVDIITGSIPLDFTLSATASKMYHRTADESLRVRFGSGVGKSISVDFWFDMVEEVIHDDY
jgi:hypothetical protein